MFSLALWSAYREICPFVLSPTSDDFPANPLLGRRKLVHERTGTQREGD
jgi:hypothetical protein